jgi:IclR family transcriptional regulator, KDG regulon repressor
MNATKRKVHLESQSQWVPAAERTLRLLALLASAPQGMTASEIMAALRIPRSALFALLNTLKTLGYVEQAEPRQPYCIGQRIYALQPPRPLGSNSLILTFHEESASHPLDETVALSMLSGAEVLTLAEAACPHAVRSVLSPGQRSQAAEHPAGWVLLAGLPEAGLQHRLGAIPKALHTTLRDVRAQGAARMHNEEQITLAVPLCPNGSQPEAALVMGIPIFRWSPQRGDGLLLRLREMAARISYRMGALKYQPYGLAPAQRIGPSVAMSPNELDTFLEGPWAARLACLRPDGSPHVVPMWYEWRDQAFLVAAWPGSLWADFVVQNPAVALTIDEPWPPMRRVLVRGQAQALPPEMLSDDVTGLYQRLSARYLGVAAQISLPYAGAGSEWRAFRIPPEKIIARQEQMEPDYER